MNSSRSRILSLVTVAMLSAFATGGCVANLDSEEESYGA
jgi:hypothetical protein